MLSVFVMSFLWTTRNWHHVFKILFPHSISLIVPLSLAAVMGALSHTQPASAGN